MHLWKFVNLNCFHCINSFVSYFFGRISNLLWSKRKNIRRNVDNEREKNKNVCNPFSYHVKIKLYNSKHTHACYKSIPDFLRYRWKISFRKATKLFEAETSWYWHWKEKLEHRWSDKNTANQPIQLYWKAKLIKRRIEKCKVRNTWKNYRFQGKNYLKTANSLVTLLERLVIDVMLKRYFEASML